VRVFLAILAPPLLGIAGLYLFTNLFLAFGTFAILFGALIITQYRNHSRGYVHDGLAVSSRNQNRAIERYIAEVKEKKCGKSN
jgi:hypothetical protein